VVAIDRRWRASLGHDAISVLILRNGHGVLARRAEARKDDRNPHHCSWQKHRLQRAWLVSPDRTGIPQVYRFGSNGQIRRWKLPVHSISCDRDNDRAGHGAEDYGGYECPLSSARAIFLPEDKQPAHARGTVCRVVDSWV
jgi:hypothetical protein